MAKNAMPRIVHVRYLPERVTPDVWQTIVFREALVDKCVVSIEELNQTPVFLDEVVEKQFGLPLHRGLELLIEVGIRANVRMDLL